MVIKKLPKQRYPKYNGLNRVLKEDSFKDKLGLSNILNMIINAKFS